MPPPPSSPGEVDLPVVGRGRLLVAAPRLGDPNFERAVVVVIEHDDDGTLGLVLNRPTTVPVAEVVAPWAEVAAMAPPAVVFAGGPVSPQVAVGLATVSPSWVGAWQAVVGDVGVVDLSADPPVQDADAGGVPGEPGAGFGGAAGGRAGGRPAVRIFAGYAGWGPGQLRDELRAGAWFVVDGQPDDLIGSDPDGLWRRVLRRQPGRLRLLASFPADPAAN